MSYRLLLHSFFLACALRVSKSGILIPPFEEPLQNIKVNVYNPGHGDNATDGKIEVEKYTRAIVDCPLDARSFLEELLLRSARKYDVQECDNVKLYGIFEGEFNR